MTGKARYVMQLERLAFFSDAVFAIAITLLVIEIRLPHLVAPTERALVNALGSLAPQYLGFLISFFAIGRFWMGHHRSFRYLKTVDNRLVWRNLLFLLTIVFMPFPTAILSEHPTTRTAVGFYSLWLALAGALNRYLLLHALRSDYLVSDQFSRALREASLRASWSPIMIGGAAFVLGMVMPSLGLIPLLGSPIILRLYERRRQAAQEDEQVAAAPQR